MKYKKRPVVIEAFQYDGDLKRADGKYYVPDWAVEAYEKGIMYYASKLDAPPELFIKTLEGTHHVSVCDYIIQGVKGELYPCKPDIFTETYDVSTEDKPETPSNISALEKLIEKQTPKKIIYQKSQYGTPWMCPECGADQNEVKFFSLVGKKVIEKYTFCWQCGQKLDWDWGIER